MYIYTYVYTYTYIYYTCIENERIRTDTRVHRSADIEATVYSYTQEVILQLPILCGIYCNSGGSGGNIILCNSAGDDGVGWDT